MSNHIDQFMRAIENAGLVAPGVIHDDGALHRFGRDKSAYYVLHADGNPAGMFGCWRAGLSVHVVRKVRQRHDPGRA